MPPCQRTERLLTRALLDLIEQATGQAAYKGGEPDEDTETADELADAGLTMAAA
jgi:hypothetical protein